METLDSFVFQTDSDIVRRHFTEHPNYLIDYNNSVPKEYCIVYFSSNDLYYPNNDIAFTESIVQKNRFEWYGNRVKIGHKHIFIRDIKKQWYLSGINATIDSPEKLIDFLKQETAGYKVITIGSSAGGFISVITGQMINAERIYSFNGQFEILSLLNKSKASVDPILFRNRNSPALIKYYDATNFIKSPTSIYYFYSYKSPWDIEQSGYVKDKALNAIGFATTNHGVPFLRSNLPSVINLSEQELKALSGKKFHPLFFSLKMVGVIDTIKGINSIVKFGLNKIYIRTFQKWKKL